MNPGAEAVVERRPASWSRGEREWTPGFSDWLGDRFLDFDLTSATSLERLQFKREFGDSAVFETALRERVEELQHLQHPSVASVRAVVRVPGKGLILESKHTAGRRLSEVFPQDRGGVLALDLIRQLMPMLVLMHKCGDTVAHGAIGPERIIVTRDGRLVLAEHVLGSALGAQQIPASRWHSSYGLPSDREVVMPDAIGDLVQIGFLALSLLIGRRLSPSDYPGEIERLVGETSLLPTGRSPEAAWLRRWLERALQIGPSPFSTAQEALENLGELSESGTVQPSANRPARYAAVVTPTTIPVVATAPATPAPVAPPPTPAASRAAEPAPKSSTKPAPRSPAESVAAMRSSGVNRWLAPGLGALAAIEAVVIAFLMISRPAHTATNVPRAEAEPVAATIPAPAPPPVTHTRPADTPPVAVTSPAPVEPPPVAAPAAPPAERFGGIRVSAAIPLQVFEDGKLLGSSQGPIAMAEGVHTLDFVNDALEVKIRTKPVVKAGQMTPVAIALPNGKLSINAIPWADVTIDGKPAGQTPLANLTVAIGEHEIIFRHPQLGEQRQTTVVKSETPARVSMSFPRGGGQ